MAGQSDDGDARAAILRRIHHDDGLSHAIESAKVQCPECDGWTGLSCPHGCGVHLVSVQAEEDAALMERMAAEDVERRARRAARKAQRGLAR